MTDKTWKPDGSTMMMLGRKFPNTEGGTMRVYGHIHFGPFPAIGDEALFEGKEGGLHFFRFTSIKHCSDPRQMYFADVKRYRMDYQGETIWHEPKKEDPALGFFARIVSAIFPNRAVHK